MLLLGLDVVCLIIKAVKTVVAEQVNQDAWCRQQAPGQMDPVVVQGEEVGVQVCNSHH